MFKLSVIDLVKFPYLDHLSDLGDLHSGKIRKNVNVWAECSYCLARSYLLMWITPWVFMRVGIDNSHPQDWLL